VIANGREANLAALRRKDASLAGCTQVVS
jgi:hypothetical protein